MSRAKAEIDRLLGQDKLSQSDVVSLMTQFRVCLEAQELKRSYPDLMLYCNWIVHPALSHSPQALQVIVSIADAIVRHPKAPNSPGFYDDVTRAFRFENFREDCIRFSSILTISDVLFSNRSLWDEFIKLVIRILVERPLEFPDPDRLPKNLKPIFQEMQEIWTSTFVNTIGIRRVSFTLGTDEPKGSVFWNLDLIPGPTCKSTSVQLRGPLKKP